MSHAPRLRASMLCPNPYAAIPSMRGSYTTQSSIVWGKWRRQARERQQTQFSTADGAAFARRNADTEKQAEWHRSGRVHVPREPELKLTLERNRPYLSGLARRLWRRIGVHSQFCLRLQSGRSVRLRGSESSWGEGEGEDEVPVQGPT
ncbi:hypothetical protein MBM_02241 [Drepanopeziza brunnea f. sp. 'multigermtubi' MB_m1]|uniref:Uncharacterized protein n=1 Tax=Marssonina brunnea f. sp. multigermtubi (strain MB_m1) TaxID=1072389 RepID=K1Y1I0_MARBU|nr:uncharacterized protein MBM_02241 [Drepanopeziza brunnea f. sp. 'multigermtubi' MB_m1]EKD19004.1 hypothetical protein MBM_02241 [Drepanopeziza brunnea f. sp. 'multigermtubi' MB_m1]